MPRASFFVTIHRTKRTTDHKVPIPAITIARRKGLINFSVMSSVLSTTESDTLGNASAACSSSFIGNPSGSPLSAEASFLPSFARHCSQRMCPESERDFSSVARRHRSHLAIGFLSFCHVLFDNSHHDATEHVCKGVIQKCNDGAAATMVTAVRPRSRPCSMDRSGSDGRSSPPLCPSSTPASARLAPNRQSKDVLQPVV